MALATSRIRHLNAFIARISKTTMLLWLVSLNIGAATIFDVSGPFEGTTSGLVLGGSSNQIIAQSWTMSTSASGVSISVPLSAGITGEPALVDAFLVDQIGSGTTAADQLAFASFSLSDAEDAPAELTIFSGIDLGPGTYYLVLSGFPQTTSNDIGDWHLPTGGSASTTISFGPGVTTPGWYAANDNFLGVDLSYAPASTFENLSDPFFGDVPGPLISVTAAPEPSMTSVLAAMALSLAGLCIRRSARFR
jgi:hypothetical protein